MKFSTGLPGLNRYPPISCEWEASLGAQDFQRVARTADELGFDSIAVSEHIVIPADMVELMGSFWSHAMTAMAFVAGATTRLIVDSTVIVMPYHDPVVFAKAVSTLDLLSGGRVRVSIGVGHAEREFEVLRAPFHERGRMTDEYLAAMIELWTSDEPEYHGTYVDFDGVAFAPKPVQQPHPPIWVGGNSARRCVAPRVTTAGIRGSSPPTSCPSAWPSSAHCPSSRPAPVRSTWRCR